MSRAAEAERPRSRPSLKISLLFSESSLRICLHWRDLFVTLVLVLSTYKYSVRLPSVNPTKKTNDDDTLADPCPAAWA